MKALSGLSGFVVLGALTVASCTGYAGHDLSPDSLPPGIPDDVREQIARLDSSRPSERGQAAFLLGRMGGRAAPAVPFLIDMFGDYVPLQPGFSGSRTSPSEEAGRALAAIGEPALGPLIEALDHEEAAIREEAVWTLGTMKDPRAVAPLVHVMRHGDGDARWKAAVGVGWIRDPAALTPLVAALKDRDPDVRKAAARSLGWLRDGRAVEPLCEALGDGVAHVAYTAAEALATIGRPAIGPPSSTASAVTGPRRAPARPSRSGSWPPAM